MFWLSACGRLGWPRRLWDVGWAAFVVSDIESGKRMASWLYRGSLILPGELLDCFLLTVKT
jgi:hypothetical protein